MIKKLLLLSMIAYFPLSVFAQTKLIEKVEKKGDEVIIPYEKYLLSNGLTLLIHEDHSEPIVHVDVTYHVGSAREENGRSGFAHFFEHMMFQGSLHVANEEHFKIVSNAGGTMNGSTNSDRTNYFETLPVNYLETALWLESDRMGFLLDSVTGPKFEVQRATVKNERGQRIDNRPYGRVDEKLGQAIYPAGHPYSWPTIGWIKDLDKENVEDLRKFFLRWYGPNNATLTVAGDVNAKNVVSLVEKYFGSLPQCPAVNKVQPMEAHLDADRFISYEDVIRFPQLVIAYPTVAARTEDEPALDVLANILGEGNNSYFYKNLIKKQLAISANASHPTEELAGQMEFSVRPMPGHDLKEMKKIIEASIAEFEQKGPTEDDLERFKAKYESSLINSLASVSGKASQLASFQTFTGNPNYIQTELKRYQAITTADVKRVYEKYIKGKHAVYLSVYPKGKTEMKLQDDNFTPSDNTNSVAASDLVYKRPASSFDRSKHPVPGAAPMMKVPDYWQENYANGLKLIGAKNAEIPVVTLQLAVDMGHRMETAMPSKAGIANLTAQMLDEATLQHTAEQLSDQLEKLGSTISIRSDNNSININVNTLVKNIDRTLMILNEKMFSPKWDTTDFNRIHKQTLQAIANQSTQPSLVADNVFRKIIYGDKSIMAIPAIGTTESLKSITVDDVRNYYNSYFSPSISNLVIVGDVDKDKILPKLTFLKDWKKKEVKLPVEAAVPAMETTKVYVVNKDNAPQSEVRVGNVSLAYDATGDYYKATIMNYILGGAFNSRINLNLRENKGWTYGARSSFTGDNWKGPFAAGGGMKGAATDSSIVEILKEIRNYRDNGIKEDELTFTKNSISNNEALKYETSAQKAAFLRRIIFYNLPKDFVTQQNRILNSMSVSAVDEIANQYLHPEAMTIVVVGDKKNLGEALSKLNYEVVYLDEDGNVKK